MLIFPLRSCAFTSSGAESIIFSAFAIVSCDTPAALASSLSVRIAPYPDFWIGSDFPASILSCALLPSSSVALLTSGKFCPEANKSVRVPCLILALTLTASSRASAFACSTISGCAAISSYCEAFCFVILALDKASCLVSNLVIVGDEVKSVLAPSLSAWPLSVHRALLLPESSLPLTAVPPAPAAFAGEPVRSGYNVPTPCDD